MKDPGHRCLSCIVENDLDTCVFHFRKIAKTPYEKNVVANALYTIDAKTSYELHEQAYRKKPNELFFILKYAMELHGKRKYEEALKLYEKYAEVNPDNFKLKVWMADCYMNTGQVEKSIQSWILADHPKQRIAIESAIHEIYGKKDLYTKRNYYRNEIKKGNVILFYELFYLDLNWEYDWWNNATIEEPCLNADIELLNQKVDKKSELYNIIDAYIKIKNSENAAFTGDLANLPKKSSGDQDLVSQNYNKTIEEVEKAILDIIKSSIAPDDTTGSVKATDERLNKSDSVKNILLTHSLILNGNPLPKIGKVASDILEVCFTNSVISRSEFFKTRGAEILARAGESKDADFLNLYAHTMPVQSPQLLEIDKRGWKEFKDERLAWDYCMHNLLSKKLKDEEINQAINDFPNSSRIYLIKTQKARLDNKVMTPYLVELIIKDFRTLDSGIGLGSAYSKGHGSYPLKLYYELLRKEFRVK